MKKYNLYLWLIALIGLFAACSQDDTADALPADTTDANRVTLTASLPADFVQPQPKSRALPVNPDAASYKLRCILEIWDTEATPALRVRQEIVPEAGDTEINFAFQLANTGTYKALLWADYITITKMTSPTEIAGLNGVNHYDDGYYLTTNGLKEVQQLSGMQPFLSDAWDAFCGSAEFTKGETALALPKVTLIRPFTRVTIAEKNAARFAACKQVTAKFKMPAQFDVATGTVSKERDYELYGEISTAVGPIFNFGTDVTIGGQTCKTLFCVYLFAGATDGTMGDITLEFTATDEGQALPTVTIPAGIPVKRNHRINAAGNLIGEPSSDAVTMTVDINSEWTKPDEEQNIDKVSVWDGTYPTSVEQAKEWLGTETTGGTDENAINHVFTITDARQLAAMHYLWVNRTKLEGAKIPDYDPNGEPGMVDATYVDASYNLATDINLNEKTWTPMGGQEVYNGNFNGQGHTVYGMNCNGSTYRTGFIATCSGTIKNLNVKGNIDVNGSGVNHGGVVGYLGGTIAFCSFQGSIKASCNNTYNTCYAGGVTGFISLKGNVTSSYSVLTHFEATGGLNNTPAKGGITGYLLGAIKGCYWQKLDGLNNAYGKKDDYRDPVVENCDQFADAAAANAAVGAMNGYAGDNDYQWQAGTDGSYPVLVKK